MKKGLAIKFTGQKKEMEDIIHQIEKEFIVTQNCKDWKTDDNGYGYIFYVLVVPKPKV